MLLLQTLLAVSPSLAQEGLTIHFMTLEMTSFLLLHIPPASGCACEIVPLMLVNGEIPAELVGYVIL